MKAEGDSSPLDHYGEIFIPHDLRACLEDQMRLQLQEAVDNNWYTPEEAEEAYAEWHTQFDEVEDV